MATLVDIEGCRKSGSGELRFTALADGARTNGLSEFSSSSSSRSTGVKPPGGVLDPVALCPDTRLAAAANMLLLLLTYDAQIQGLIKDQNDGDTKTCSSPSYNRCMISAHKMRGPIKTIYSRGENGATN